MTNDPPLGPPAVSAALGAAPILHCAPSTPVSAAELDAGLAAYDVPVWDHEDYFCAAMRLTAFVIPGGTDGLAFQALLCGSWASGIWVQFGTVGFGRPPGLRHDRGISVLHQGRHPEQLEPDADYTLTLPNGEATVRTMRWAEFDHEFGPLESAMLTLTADEAGRDRVFLDATQLVDHLGLPTESVPLFVWDNWDQPHTPLDHDDPRSPSVADSVDLILAVEALRGRRAVAAPVARRSRADHLLARIEEVGGFGHWPEG